MKKILLNRTIHFLSFILALHSFAEEDVQVQIKPKGNKIVRTRTVTKKVVKPAPKNTPKNTIVAEEEQPPAPPKPLATPVPTQAPAAPQAAAAPVQTLTTPALLAASPTPRPVEDWLKLQIIDEYYGPSIGDPRPRQYDPQEVYESGDSQHMLFSINTGYKFNKRFSTYWRTRLDWNLNTADPDSGISSLDGRLYFQDSDLLTIDTFKASAKYYISPSTSAKSREINRLFALAFQPFLNYDIPDTKISISSEFVLRYIFYKHGQNAGYPAKPTKDMDLYFIPSISWQFLPTVAAQVAYEMDGKHHKGEDWFTYRLNTVYGTTYLQPGISWDVTPKFNLNPYLTLYVGDKVSMKTTNLTIVGAYTFF